MFADVAGEKGSLGLAAEAASPCDPTLDKLDGWKDVIFILNYTHGCVVYVGRRQVEGTRLWTDPATGRTRLKNKVAYA